MGKQAEISIVLANPQAVYLPGQSVEGQAVVALSEEMKMRGVRVIFSGNANVYWRETRTTGSGDTRKTETVYHRSTENYFVFEIRVFGQGSDSVTLSAGHHTFPFQYTLPVNLPSSFESDIGNVRFGVMAIIERPWKFDYKTTKLFTVVTMLDLNLEPAAPEAAEIETSKMLCCLCCKSGPISVKFHIDRTGYVPGDTIRLKAEISNMTRRRIRSSKVKLLMVSIIEDVMTRERAIVKMQILFVKNMFSEKGADDAWSAEPMVVPAVPPSYLKGCNIIDINYVLQLTVVPAGPALDLLVQTKVIIGTIPLRQAMHQSQMYPLSTPPGVAGPMHDPNMAMPAPTFAACVFGKQTVQDDGDSGQTSDDKAFAPVYTYYDWSKTNNTQ